MRRAQCVNCARWDLCEGAERASPPVRGLETRHNSYCASPLLY
jgi:hypothetical protein